MQISQRIDLFNGTYQVAISLATDADALSAVEKDKLAQFGEMVIACGGTFPYGDSLTFTRPTDDRRFPSQFPVVARFSLADAADANAQAVAFRDTLLARLAAALETLLGKTPGTIGRQVTTLA